MNEEVESILQVFHFRRRKILSLAGLASLFLLFLFQGSCESEISSNMDMPYLGQQYDWAVFIEVKNVSHYLNYSGTTLHPLTKVRIYFRQFKGLAEPSTSKLCEEIWYYKSIPIGSRCLLAPAAGRGTYGALVIGNQDGTMNHAAAATDAAMRMMIDLLASKAATAAMIVPLNSYENVVRELCAYGFTEHKLPGTGKHMSVVLRSFPESKDDQLFVPN